jgi:hypothetical protein
MTRARAAWLAAAVVALAAVGYVVRRWTRRPAPVAARTEVSVPAPVVPTESVPTTTEAAITTPTHIGSSTEPAVAGVDTVDPLADNEQPMATWARAAIIAVALVVFFAVSLIATRHV